MNMVLTKHLCTQTPEIRVHGRTSNRKTNGIPLFWTASAIEINVTGTELWLEYTCTGDAYLRVEIDGFDMYRFPIDIGTHKVCIMRGLSADQIKNVRIFRETSALASTQITINALYTDGDFRPIPERKYKIEAFGDSVTAGEGLAGAPSMTEWSPAVFSSRGHYVLTVAKAFDADWSIVAHGGWGVFTDYKNNREHAVPKEYDYVCGSYDTPEAIELGSRDIFDVENDKTNITLINLGANDSNAYNENAEAWVDENGLSHKLKRPDDLHYIVEAVYHFCSNIRKRNKNTIILVCHNTLTDALDPQIIEGVERFKQDTGEDKIYTVCLPRATPELKGSRHHPGAKAHERFAQAIIAKLNEIL